MAVRVAPISCSKLMTGCAHRSIVCPGYRRSSSSWQPGCASVGRVSLQYELVTTARAAAPHSRCTVTCMHVQQCRLAAANGACLRLLSSTTPQGQMA